MSEQKDVFNIQNEVLFIGSFYTKPDLYVEYGKHIKSKYDFSDETTRFFYDNFELMYKTFSQTFDEMKVNTFMSQDKERLASYKKYGGYKTLKTWMDIANVDDFKNYMNIIKKYSLIREFDRKGYAVQKILNHSKFNLFTAKDIYRLIRSGADKIGTIILSNDESKILNEDVQDAVKKWVAKPQMGLEFPFPLLNDMFRGQRLGKFFCNGFLSNEGKTRLVALMCANTALVHGEKVLVMCNETSEEDFLACLIVTVINNPQFKDEHGIDLIKPERELVLGLYRGSDGKFLERVSDEWGNFTESEEDYLNRLHEESEEYRKVLNIAGWIMMNVDKTIFFKYLNDFSDENIEFEIRKHCIVHNIKYFYYDTLKSYQDENWAILKQTATNLSGLALELMVFIWGSIQLTDESINIDIFNFSSQNIANAKQMKHVLDFLTLGKKISKDEYHKLEYMPHGQWGTQNACALDLNKVYYGLKVDKNRGGDKDKIPLLEVDLDLNTWIEIGYLVKKGKA